MIIQHTVDPGYCISMKWGDEMSPFLILEKASTLKSKRKIKKFLKQFEGDLVKYYQ